jgi:uncharacterized protein (TIGR03382 family)
MSMKSIVAIAGLATLALTGAASAQWTSLVISDGDTFSRVPAGTGTTLNASTTGGAAGITGDFRTTGATGTDHAFTNWWWYRANGDTRERALAAPSSTQAAVVRSNTASSVEYSNIQPELAGTANAGLRFTLSYRVQDLDGPGGNSGRMITSLTVLNTGSTVATNVNLYHYFDYFFTGEDGGDQALAGNTGVSGSTRYIGITDATDLTNPSFNNLLHEGFGANAYTVGSFSVVGGQMGDSNVDNFSDLNSALLPGDQSGVFQWVFGDIAPGASATATAQVTINTIIPAPGSLALLGMGGLIVGRRRR